MKFFTFFVEGGLGVMSVLTVLLVALFFAAWKAPRWVKEIGLFALLFGFLGHVLGMLQVFDALVDLTAGAKGYADLFDAIHPAVIFGGLKVTLISTVYGIIIYLISLVVRVIQKPRL
ncbi:MAG: MotA/TolQ/ExbB proton channel family protein [Bacteroidales bacterium]|nr:MotA/TolQ/ExbB proton channel family protein [Bacteroidales bacterium]